MATTTQPTTGTNATATRTSTSSPLCIGLDLVRPYGVYLDHQQVAKYDSRAEAEQHFEQLRRIHKTGGAA
ncbi:hypothetical protein [Rhodoferax sp. WC2427]|uniref:hypothetical protein n=1 Tax=Rhodoferax sp. WC2427 TaxID=3234144 RepID=UPI00346796B0